MDKLDVAEAYKKIIDAYISEDNTPEVRNFLLEELTDLNVALDERNISRPVDFNIDIGYNKQIVVHFSKEWTK